MLASSVKSEFKPWNAPHLLTNQFQLLAKLIEALNANVPPEKESVKVEILKELELKIINVFSHQMMPSWLALAKFYYPFYKISEHEKVLIEELEQKLNIKAKDYESLSELINKVFFTKYSRVNSQYQPLLDNIELVMSKLTAVVLSTPALLNEAHQYDKKQFEEAGPSMSNCVSPIETILRLMINRADVDKSFIIAATSLLVQVKEIKAHFSQITLIQQLERLKMENETLQKQQGEAKHGLQINPLPQSNEKCIEESNQMLELWQSKQEQLAMVKVFQLQKRISLYYEHLTAVLTKSPKDNKAEAKLITIATMKTDLDKGMLLPSKRIEMFQRQLNQEQEQLKDHRDPMWMRFLRDCLRILALTCSGVAIYRKLTDQPVNFFKPSHGQGFVEDANRIVAVHVMAST